ncbi:MAG: c-type cytochrome domain-containing protein, partial [Phycisphaerales bacterium]
MRRIVSTILLLLTSAASAQTMEGLDQAAAGEQRPLTADELKFFESKVRPLLIANCYGCHSTSGGKSKGGLKLDTREATLKGGNSGPAVVPGDPDSSLLVRAVRYHDEDSAMPPAGKLPDADIETLEQWVAMGAPDPRADAPAGSGASPGTTHRWTAEDISRGRETHWSYRPVSTSVAPSTKDGSWGRSPIDSFVLS